MGLQFVTIPNIDDVKFDGLVLNSANFIRFYKYVADLGETVYALENSYINNVGLMGNALAFFGQGMAFNGIVDLSSLVDYVSNVSLMGTNLTFTGQGSAFNGFVDLSGVIDYVSDVQLIGNNLTFTGQGSAFSGAIDLGALSSSDYISNIAFMMGTTLTFTGVGAAFNGGIDLSSLGPDYISNAVLIGTDLTFTGTGSAFNGIVDLSGLVGGNEDNIYTTDGSIPNGVDRVVTIPNISSLTFFGTNTQLYMNANSFLATSNFWSLAGNLAGGSISSGDTEPLLLTGPNNMQIQPGSGGSIPNNVVGQVLTAIDVNGTTVWDYPVLMAIDEGNGTGYVIGDRDASNYGNIGLRAVDLSFSTSISAILGATGNYSMAIGFEPTASGANSFAGGTSSIASGANSFSYGFLSQATNTGALSIGTSVVASGPLSVAFGNGTIASEAYSFASGTTTRATGLGSCAFSVNNFARSYAETALGSYGTDYVAVSELGHSPGDRVFNIGNGVNSGARSDAFTVLKNSNVGINISNFEAADTGETLQVNGDAKIQGVVRTDGYTVATLPAGTVGDRAYVTDASAPTYLAVAVGGGAITCPVFFDGTNWITA